MERYPNIHLIEHEYNKKLGTARNTGRSIAQGKYIWNVDSDDYIAPNCLKKMIFECDSNDLDVLAFSHSVFSGDNLNISHKKNSSNIVKGIDLLNIYANNNFDQFCPIWRYLFKKSFLDDNFLFSPKINLGEDVPFTYSSLISASRVKMIPDSFYIYRINDVSLTGASRRLSPSELYEKCFINAKLVKEVADHTPKKYVSVKKSIVNLAKYTISIYPKYLDDFSNTQKIEFITLCRKGFLNNLKTTFTLFSKRKIIEYILLLLSIKSR